MTVEGSHPTAKPLSPYGVPAKSVAAVPQLTTEPLTPFEQQAVKYLTTQYNAQPKRVQDEFLASIIRI